MFLFSHFLVRVKTVFTALILSSQSPGSTKILRSVRPIALNCSAQSLRAYVGLCLEVLSPGEERAQFVASKIVRNYKLSFLIGDHQDRSLWRGAWFYEDFCDP